MVSALNVWLHSIPTTTLWINTIIGPYFENRKEETKGWERVEAWLWPRDPQAGDHRVNRSGWPDAIALAPHTVLQGSLQTTPWWSVLYRALQRPHWSMARSEIRVCSRLGQQDEGYEKALTINSFKEPHVDKRSGTSMSESWAELKF